MKILLFISVLMFSHAWASSDAVEDLWEKLKDDFESKPYFFNNSLNDFRDGVMSPFMASLNGDDFYNNAIPLSSKQIAKLPDGHFLDKKPFALAMAGRARLLKAGKIKNFPILAVVDFSLHNKARRLFILDIEKGEVLINTYTSHAYNTDSNQDGFADAFSNVNGSEKTSIGFTSTDVTYYGNYGYSLRLRGLDPKLNSNVLARAVVVHGFGGMDPQQASMGNVATSLGCLMISTNESGRFWGMDDKSMVELVIGALKPGALVFNYTDKEEIFLSDWIKKTDVPAEEGSNKSEGEAVPYEQLQNQGEVVDHLSESDILPAKF